MGARVEEAWRISVDLDEFVKSDEGGRLYRPGESMRRRRTGPLAAHSRENSRKTGPVRWAFARESLPKRCFSPLSRPETEGGPRWRAPWVPL